ncbi:non-ribosomal peptide synthetase [Emericellopsis cladophorae]|uniref:Non-ribosomal peptide synthetase n=1 Tax=Emericellopsis cladophorae TaxID=2686198 RepID=A0A9P9XVK8_9HYPO|nr:non-ribosomal peptide synthetase [Emericellopsis cladophorae]KAI6778555.1 non-ribosomal peptide synthetase [Emericellopsis cladophorae]
MDSSEMLSIINPQPAKLPGPALLHELVAGPSSSPALDHLRGSVRTSFTYDELHAVSDTIAVKLSSVVRNRDAPFVVPILMRQSPILYASLLGILKAGAAFCPLNLDAPPERVSFILQDVSAAVVLVEEDLAARMPEGVEADIMAIQWKSDKPAISENSPKVATTDLAYVMYTSGSTGTPKGVGLSHGAATQALFAHERHIPLFKRFLQFAAPTFDVSVFEIFFPLARGRTLVSVERGQLLDDLAAAIRETNVDACELTPTVAGSLLRSRDAVPELKLLLTIGEMLTEPVIHEFGGREGRESILWAMYGPTEATIHCTLQPAMQAASTVRNIGFPLDTVSAFVIQPAESGEEVLRILPLGEVGELAVGGHQLAEGYLDRPTQTAAAFIETPYGRLYRTGDKARVLSDGTLECLGRLSEGQVKLRGQRLEINEVQQAILRVKSCHGAVVAVHESTLVAFCATDPGVLEDVIRDECKKWLPQFMIPGVFVMSDSFPKLPSGKVNKRKLLDILPCSALQTAMLAETVGRPGLYWNELELDVADSVSRVAAAFTKILEQTAILRGIFVLLDGNFVCLVKQDVDEEQIKIVDCQSHFSLRQTIADPTFQVQLCDNDHGGTRVCILAHHAIYDGWSMDIILADINRLLSGQSIPKRTPFAEVVAVQRWLASSSAADRSGAYWAAHLQGLTKDSFPVLVDRLGGQPDPIVIADQVEIPYSEVHAVSKALGCSMQALFQAALYVVWAGILGSADVVLGAVSSGRSLPMGGIEETIGPCIAALPLRVDFERFPGTEQLLRHIHSCNRAMLEHSIVPLGEIRKMMGLRASQTVYDLLFVYQQSSESESKRRSLLNETRRLDRLETPFLFEVEPNDTSFSIQITYHPDCARVDMMRMLLQQFNLAFGHLVEQPHCTLADMRRALNPVPALYNISPVPLEGTLDLAAMFEQVVEKSSDRDALSFTEPGHESPFAKTTVTYQELNVLSNRIAHFLLSQGVGANQIVGVILEKSIFLYATILAVLKTGCAYLPLLPSTPADRVEDILRLAKVRHCAVDTASVRLFGHLGEARLVDVERAPLDDFQSCNLGIPHDRDRLAYVIFTSGTTGTPKGVAVTHGNIVSNVDYLSGVYPVQRGVQSNFLQACSQAFDVSVFEIFFAWKTGMCLCTSVNDTLFADLALMINELSITHLSLTPTVASLISRETCPGVEFLVTAGEPLTRSVLEQWGDILWQGYGPSETTNICSVKQMQTDMVVDHLGWVFPNTSVMVMAIGSLEPVPVGWVGEFCYGGDQVAQGYLNMPELTAEKFLQDSRFGRIYRSGDMGRMLPDGSLVILGRIDDQLKLRGQRIEAAEINNIIVSTPWASSAIVILGRRSPDMPEQLVAFYVPAEHVSGDGLLDVDHEASAGLYSLMQSKLPSYMVPSYLIPLARIPMTRSGKINKKHLQVWFQDLPSRYLEAAVPQATLTEDGSKWSTMESDLHTALIQSLEISATEANRWTPFANLGIDSVSAIRLARDLSISLNCRVAVSSIIRNPSIAQLARHLGEQDFEKAVVVGQKTLLPQSCVEKLRHSFLSQDKAVASILPCTPLQAALLSRGGRNYYNKVLLRLKIDASRMQTFWNCMSERHEILRTCFATTEDADHSIAQVVLREWSIPWQQFDATTPSFEKIIQSHLERLPDPVNAMTPPVSLALIRRGTSSFLSFICHHSLYDGVAIDILWREVESLAAGEQLLPAVPYEPLLQEMANLPANTEAFWKKHFHDFVPSYAFPSTAGETTDQALVTKSFTPLRLVQKIVGCQGVGLFETLLLLQQPLHPMDDRVWILEEDKGTMDLPVVCEIVPCPSLDSLVVDLHYDMNFIDPSVACALAGKEKIPGAFRFELEKLRPRRDKGPVIRGHLSSGEWSVDEITIRKAVAELSRQPLEKVARNTTIFQLGLDSINAVQIASKLRLEGLHVSSSQVLEYPTCAALAENLKKGSQIKAPSLAYNLRVFPGDVADECALHTAFLQTRGHHYFNSMTFKVNSSIGIITFTEAWKLMCRQHPMLRTALVPVSHPDTAYAMARHAPMYDLPMTILNHGEQVSELVGDLRASLLAHPQLPPWHVFAHDGENGITMTLLIHHALYDAQSLDEILVSLGKILQGEAHELNIAPVEPGLQVIMSRHIADQTESRLFWESKATDVVINNFPIMTPLREAATSLRSEASTLSLSFSHLRDAAMDVGVTVHAAINAAWARVLASYLGEEAVVFGSTISERTSEATKCTPIPCITTLPVLARATPSNLGLLKNMMEFTTQVRKHQPASLSSVQKWLGHPATPIFDTLVSYRKRDEQEFSRPFELLSDNATLDYKVSMEIEAGPDDCVRLTTTFMPHILPTEQGRMLLDQFDAVLSHLVLHPGETEDELHRLTPKLFSRLPPKLPVMPTTVQYLHQLVEEKARTNPDSTALEFIDSLHQGTMEKRIWTYRQLNERGNQVANMLSTKAPVGSIVAVHFDKCPEAYFSILGILKAGCSFVALDPTAPASRKSFILEDSKAPCVLTTAESTFSGTTTEVVRTSMSVLDEFSTESPVLDILSPDATCYCLYTSGTTGTPKGCEITHENAVQAMMAFQDLFSGHWQADSRWLQFASLHFDVSVLEQYWTWSVGITLVAAPKDIILDDLPGSINKLGITHIDLTPSLARLTHPSEVPSLCKGVFITGGESLKQEILDVWGPKAVIYNAYGPTEATIGVTMYQRVPANGRPSNIGKQFPNVGSYVFKLDTEVPVLRGGVGELCVSGKLVGKGYLNRPDLTAERFPTLQNFSEKIYRTGDLVRVLHDGCFEFLGRADDQVKLRGQRLEIGEINHAIRGVSEIQDAATVVATQGPSEKSVLVAFIVSSTANNKGNLEVVPDIEGLGLKAKEACRTKLPGYMVPTYFLQLPFIPLSVNNKAEAKDLRRLFANLSHAQLSALIATPRSSRSTVNTSSLAKLTKALSTYSGLKQDDVTEDTSIFDLGVDSITVLRLASYLKEQGFDAATPTALLRNPVINDLASALCQKISHSQEVGIKEAEQLMAACKHRYLPSACRTFHIQPEDIEYIAPCSPLQGGIVSRSLASAEGHAYFNTFELKLSPHLGEDKLRHAWDSLVSELAILRTCFLATPSGPIQVALKAVQLPWEHVELPTEEETQHALTSMRKNWLSTNGRNVSEPLQVYFVVSGGKTSLFVNIFHGIYDGMSFDLMLSRLAAKVDDCQHVSLQRIQKWCSGGRPLFNTLFALQMEQSEDYGVWKLVDGELNPDYPLAFEATMMKDGNLRLQLVAQGHVATVAVLDEMLDAFNDSLHQAMKDSSQPVPFGAGNDDLSSSGRTESSNVGDEPPLAFTWTGIAETIRSEMCTLSGASEKDIRGNSTILELGLDSIDVMKLSAALRRCGVKLAASQIMRLQSVSNIVSLAEETPMSPSQTDNATTNFDVIRQRLRENLTRSTIIDMTDVEDVLPATPLQESMVTAMVESDFQWYFNHDLLQLSEDTDVERLKKAWTQVVEAHPILRAGFYPVEDDSLDNAFYQVIHTKNNPWVECLVAEGLDEADRVMERCRLRAKDGKGQTALLQLSLMSVGSQRFVVLSMAHALYDGWSQGLLYRELQNAYNGQLLQARSPDVFLGRLLEASSAQSQEFWSDYLRGSKPTHLSVSLQTEPSATPRFSEATSDVSLDTVKAFCKDLGITMQTLCQASWALILAHYTKQLDIVFGVIMSGRDFEGAEELMFPTMNTVAMRYILHGTARSFLQYVEESMNDVRQHQSYPLRKALTAARAPMGGFFNTLFMLQKSAETESSTLVHSVRGVSAVDYPVCVEAEAEQGQISWRIAVQPGFAPLEPPSNLLRQLDGVLSFFIKSPGSDLLSFTAAGISLGGLPSFAIKEDADSEDESKIATPPTGEEDWSGIANTIRGVLSQASGVDEMSIQMTDTLYHLGLDSISSLRVSRLLRQQDLDLRPRDLIRAESIAHLVEMATANQSDSEGSQDQQATVTWQPPPSLDVDGLLLHHNLQYSDVEAILPALPMQVFVLGTWQNTNGDVFYPTFTYELDSSCSKEEMVAAWGLVTASTPILRTRFMATGDRQLPLLQVVLKSEASDLVHLQPGERTEAGRWRLRLQVHHALYDGVSLPLLMQRLLHALVSGSLPNSPLDLWNRYTTNPYLPSSVSARKAFWTSYLWGVEPYSGARKGYPIRPRMSFIARSAVRDTSLLQRHAAARGVGVQSLFLAAYAKVLLARGHEGGGDEVVFGVYLANRQEDTSLDGSFPRLNLVPLRVKATGTLESVASRVQRDLRLIMSQGRADVGLWEVEAWTGVKLTSFVNFLSLPDGDEEEDGPFTHAMRVRVVEGGAASEEELTAHDTSSVGDVVVRDVFPPAVDIEASLRDKSLDIGIFGLGDGDGDAQSLVSELGHALDV